MSGFETSNDQYTLVCNVRLSFSVDGKNIMCYNYSITDDEDCELGEMVETVFKVRLALLTFDIGLHSGYDTATIVIDDRDEPECCKLVFWSDYPI